MTRPIRSYRTLFPASPARCVDEPNERQRNEDKPRAHPDHACRQPAAAADAVALLLRKERGEPYDAAEFDRVIKRPSPTSSPSRPHIGIDVVSDGETSKIGYSTYIKDRFTGFGGEFTPKPHLDLADYPEFRKRMAAFLGPQQFRRLCCIGPVAPRTAARSSTTSTISRRRSAAQKVVEGFHERRVAGRRLGVPAQPVLSEPRGLYRSAGERAAPRNTRRSLTAGFVLQVDCPDLAMSRHTGFQDLSEAEFLKRAEFDIEALNHALANVPADKVRLHLCWGNYEGPHDFDIALEKMMPIIRKAKAQAISFEAANPRHEHEWKVWRDAKLPDDKILIPGVIDSSTNYVEHPELVAQRIERYAGIVGRERVIAGTDCGFGTFAGYAKVDPGDRLQETQVAGRRRGDRVEAAVEVRVDAALAVGGGLAAGLRVAHAAPRIELLILIRYALQARIVFPVELFGLLLLLRRVGVRHPAAPLAMAVPLREGRRRERSDGERNQKWSHSSLRWFAIARTSENIKKQAKTCPMRSLLPSPSRGG